MAMDFPASPTVGQIYSPVGGPVYRWDGSLWVPSSAAILADDSVAHGSVQLDVSGGNVILRPWNGGKLIINDAPRLISTDLTLAPTGVAANTTYFIYAYMNGLVPTLEYSTTTYAIGPRGVKIKSGDASRTLVGCSRSAAAGAWAGYGGAFIGIRSLFNEPPYMNRVGVTVSSAADIASVGYTTINNLYGLSWDVEDVEVTASGTMQTLSANTIYMGIGLNSVLQLQIVAAGAANDAFPYGPVYKGRPGVGYHTWNLMASSGSATLYNRMMAYYLFTLELKGLA